MLHMGRNHRARMLPLLILLSTAAAGGSPLSTEAAVSFDTASKKLVWRGVGSAKVQGPPNDKMRRKIEKIVHKLSEKLSDS